MPEVAAHPREQLWNELVMSLKPWERHRLLKDGTELVMHDAFVFNEATEDDVRLVLSFDEGEE